MPKCTPGDPLPSYLGDNLVYHPAAKPPALRPRHKVYMQLGGVQPIRFRAVIIRVMV